VQGSAQAGKQPPLKNDARPAPLVEYRLGNIPLQRKLEVGSSDDPLEREADAVAEQVMRMPDPTAAAPPMMADIPPVLQRKCSCVGSGGGSGRCGQCAREDELHRSAAAPGPAPLAPPIVHNVLQQPGAPLDESTRAFFEPRFGRDLNHVRVHADAYAQESARAVNALAYTVGPNIAFASGQYAPYVSEGRRLIAHELTHVVQQELGGPRPDARHEGEATNAAQTISAGRKAVISVGSAIGLARVQDPALSVALSWDELFGKVVSDQRAFLFTRPAEANNPAVDPAGVGRGVGPDRTKRGLEVLAAIQIVDRNGKRVGSIGFGAHALLPGGHGEEQALAGLRASLPANEDVRGGKMMVVVDQYPCGLDRHDCGQQLRDFASERGLELEVKVPLREHVQNPGVNVKPRTASRGAYRTDLDADPRTRVSLVTIDQQPGPGSGPGGPAGAGGRVSVLDPALGEPAPSAVRSSPSRPPSAAQTIANQKAISKLDAETAESVNLTKRIQTYSAAIIGLVELIKAFYVIIDAIDFAARGTITDEGVLKSVEQTRKQSDEARIQAADEVNSISFLTVADAIHDAIDRDDSDTLDAFAKSLGDLGDSISVEALANFSGELSTQAQELKVKSDDNFKSMFTTEGIAQGQAFMNWDSLNKLQGNVQNAADNYADAAATLSWFKNYISTLAGEASQAAWAIGVKRLVDLEQQRQQQHGNSTNVLKNPQTPEEYQRKLDEFWDRHPRSPHSDTVAKPDYISDALSRPPVPAPVKLSQLDPWSRMAVEKFIGDSQRTQLQKELAQHGIIVPF
jgi:hypothetical protein